jgi:hypothetical protein
MADMAEALGAVTALPDAACHTNAVPTTTRTPPANAASVRPPCHRDGVATGGDDSPDWFAKESCITSLDTHASCRVFPRDSCVDGL